MKSNELEFEQIYAVYQPKIHRYLNRMVGEFEAEDLTQEVFIKVSQALENFRGDAELSTWIYRIATNAAFDRLRSPAYQKTVQNCSTNPSIEDGGSENVDTNVSKAGNEPLVEQQVFHKAMSECLMGFINNLPEAYRTVLVLSEFEGLSNNDIAEILGVTLDTVKIRLHRARERLKEQLATHCGSEWVEGNEFVPELKRPDVEILKPI
jgi:RNA polymerase sigma-70 factor (ECF subfamily)